MFNAIRKLIFRYSPLENPAIPLNSPEAYSLFALPTASGIPVTYRACMGYGPIRKGVSLIAGHVAKLPIYVYRTTGDGRKRDLTHPAYRLLGKKPSDIYTAFNFRRQMQAYTLIYGNAYAYIVRENGNPTELLMLDPESTWVTMSSNNEPIYHTRMNTKSYTFASEDVLHIKDFGDGVVGDGLVHIARDALGLSLAMLKYTSAYFRNGTHGERFLILPPLLADQEKRKQFVEEYKKHYAGADNAYKDKWLPSGTDIKETGASPDKSQLIESREHDLIQIADLLNLPPHKLGANIATSYSSLQAENQAFLDDCLDFWLVQWEQEIEAKLLRENEKHNDLRTVQFDRTELLRMDPKTEGELRLSKLNGGGISFEEYRQQEDLPTTKDEDQEWRHLANVVIEGEEPEPEPPPQPPIPPAIPPEEEETKVDEKGKKLTRGIVERFITRVVKSGKPMEDHKSVWLDNLPLERAEHVFTELLKMEEELKAMLPEQRADLISAITGELWI